jgi:ribose transport system ATP-binding protein
LDVPSLSLYAGQVVGLVGENGAGKSTMMGTLAGSVHRDGGEITVGGVALPAGSTEAAQRLGVAMVSQEFPLVGQLSVTENLLLGRRPNDSRSRILTDRRAQRLDAVAMLEDIGLTAADVDVDREVRSLPVPTRQLIEIAKAWGRDPKLLILDEPTSSLGPVEAQIVLRLARELADRGGAVLFVGHRLDEVREVSDRVIVLRNGALVADLTPSEATEARLIKEMVGGELTRGEARKPRTDAAVRLTVSGLMADGLGPVDLDVREGEIVGVAGLMGSGRSRLLHTIAGAQPATHGRMLIDGQPYVPRTPQDGAAAGIALIPEDRKEQSLVLFGAIWANITVSILKRLSHNGILPPKVQRTRAQEIASNVKVRMQSIDQPIGSLSGGNQQRAIFGRAFATEPTLLLLDEPTRGVDVGAKAEIYELINRAADGGMAVLVASSELEELQLICDRIAVMNHGHVVEVFDRAQASKERIMAAAAGTEAVAGRTAASSKVTPNGDPQ